MAGKFDELLDGLANAVVKKIESKTNGRIAVLEVKVDDVLENHLPSIETKLDDLRKRLYMILGGLFVVELVVVPIIIKLI